jgi:hypothetical protein
MAVSRPSNLNLSGNDKVRDLKDHEAASASPTEQIEPLLLIGID